MQDKEGYNIYSWDDTLSLLNYDFIIIKGDSGTGMSFLGKKLAGKGYYIFNENLLFEGSPDSPALFRDLANCLSEKNKAAYIGNNFNSKPELLELVKPDTRSVTVSFASYPNINIPVKEYIILS